MKKIDADSMQQAEHARFEYFAKKVFLVFNFLFILSL